MDETTLRTNIDSWPGSGEMDVLYMAFGALTARNRRALGLKNDSNWYSVNYHWLIPVSLKRRIKIRCVGCGNIYSSDSKKNHLEAGTSWTSVRP